MISVRLVWCLCALLLWPAVAAAQTTATLRGTVLDEQGGVVPGVTVQLTRALTGLSRQGVTGPDGAFEWTNLPLDRYDLRADLSGFEPYSGEVALRTSVPTEVTLILRVATQSTTVRVTPESPLVDPTITGTRT